MADSHSFVQRRRVGSIRLVEHVDYLRAGAARRLLYSPAPGYSRARTSAGRSSAQRELLSEMSFQQEQVHVRRFAVDSAIRCCELHVELRRRLDAVDRGEPDRRSCLQDQGRIHREPDSHRYERIDCNRRANGNREKRLEITPTWKGNRPTDWGLSGQIWLVRSLTALMLSPDTDDS